MKERMKTRSVCVITLLLLVSLVACQSPSRQTQAQTEAEEQQPEEELQLLEGFVGEDQYEQEVLKPETQLNIFVDLTGYSCDDTKHAYFVGENLAEEFSVYAKEDNRLVFTGKIEEAQIDEVTQKAVSRGDFSELKESGVYYIQTAIIGRSYSFRITENRYIKQFQELQNRFLEQTPAQYYSVEDPLKERTEVLVSLLNLSLAYEFFAEQMKEAYPTKLAQHAQWILDTLSEADYSTWETQDLYMLSAALASYSASNQTRETALSKSCLVQAQKAYQTAVQRMSSQTKPPLSQNAAQESEDILADAQYMAAAAIYKASGAAGYHAAIKIRFSQPAEELEGSNFYTFYGDLFYMTTTSGVDTELCETLMTQMLGECGEMSDAAAKTPFGLGSRILEGSRMERSETTGDLYRLTQLAMADYIIVSREYRNACKEQVHYLLRNTETENLDVPTRSALLLVMSNLAESEEEK